MATEIRRDPDLEWLGHVQPVGLVIAPLLIKELGLTPLRQTQADSAVVAQHVDGDARAPALGDPWAFVEQVLGWEAPHVAGSPGGPPVSDALHVRLPEHDTTLSPTWSVAELGNGGGPWQLLVRIEAAGVDPDARAMLGGWEATPHQRFERLLRETGVYAGVLITERNARSDGEDRYVPELRLVYAPRGETSGHLSFPLRDLASVPGRPMLGGLKLLLDSVRLFTDGDDRRLPALLKRSREAQAAVSTELAGQVLGALHELLRGLDAAAPELIRGLARTRPEHLYEGLLTVLMRLVFILYAEDRDLLPSLTDGRARKIYETSYSLRGLYEKLTEDAALNPDTMDERRGAWGRLLALFRLIHGGHRSHFVQARGGKLFDPGQFPFLEGRADGASASVPVVSDGCVWRILEGLTTLQVKGGGRERLSYRTLDVEQIGSVYETVMGFTVEVAAGRSLAIKAGKHNRTPVFVDLEKLVAAKGKDRIKFLKEEAERAALSAGVARAVEAAKNAADMAAALDAIVDERGSPKKQESAEGTPILQPTDERRRTGSHYTPRSLTEPIVRHALEPAFERLGANATPEQILDLKICDMAMGSGAFLVEACRQLATRLVAAWDLHKDKKPAIPPDEDDDLHARRLVAQRCLYGVDKNPLATDLAKLSLWLATLARDHEFTFLDHALKSGDSLVGLTREQIEAANWDLSKDSAPLLRGILRERVNEVALGRHEIQAAPDDVARSVQEARHRILERRLEGPRLYGEAIIAAFFAGDKPRTREEKRVEVAKLITGLGAERERTQSLQAIAAVLKDGGNPLTPFHWEIEFPEVFARENAGFDAIVGNPPFMGGKRITESNGGIYNECLSVLQTESGRSADLIAHFLRRGFDLLCPNGALGLIATNTIGQGDTRAAGLVQVLQRGGVLYRVVKRLEWPGEAAVIVSIIHLKKGAASSAILDGRHVSRISAYLVEGSLDSSPHRLRANKNKAFQGTIILGMGFTFDDKASSREVTSSLEEMKQIIERNNNNTEVIKPYIGGEEINNDPSHAHRRYVIDFDDLSAEAASQRWPELWHIVERRVRPERQAARNQKYERMYHEWWKFWNPRYGLYEAVKPLCHVLAITRHSPQFSIARLPARQIFADSLVVFAFCDFSAAALLQSRVHELWVRFFGSSIRDDLRYTPSDCFETFPFPEQSMLNDKLELIGEQYFRARASIMIENKEGMTSVYKRFHDRDEHGDIKVLRSLHAELDRCVLEAYGWKDLAYAAEAIFLNDLNETDFSYFGRLFWPPNFRDVVLSRLLTLNRDHYLEER
jgi:N-6 DNA Methylase